MHDMALSPDAEQQIRRIIREEMDEDRVLWSGFNDTPERRERWLEIVKDHRAKFSDVRGA